MVTDIKISGLEPRELDVEYAPGHMRRFNVYRPAPPSEYLESGIANATDEVQFEGVVFSDGIVVIRWLTEHRSTSLWDSLADLVRVHGHPEYETRWEWVDS
jgi:hypothetical protein